MSKVEIIPPSKESPVSALKRKAKSGQAKLTSAFLDDVNAVWEQEGRAIAEAAALKDPVGFMKIVASMTPKQIEVTQTNVEEVDDSTLEKLLASIGDAIDRRVGALEGPTAGREVEADEREETVDVSSLF